LLAKVTSQLGSGAVGKLAAFLDENPPSALPGDIATHVAYTKILAAIRKSFKIPVQQSGSIFKAVVPSVEESIGRIVRFVQPRMFMNVPVAWLRLANDLHDLFVENRPGEDIVAVEPVFAGLSPLLTDVAKLFQSLECLEQFLSLRTLYMSMLMADIIDKLEAPPIPLPDDTAAHASEIAGFLKKSVKVLAFASDEVTSLDATSEGDSWAEAWHNCLVKFGKMSRDAAARRSDTEWAQQRSKLVLAIGQQPVASMRSKILELKECISTS
jgi:hypothetical protein